MSFQPREITDHHRALLVRHRAGDRAATAELIEEMRGMIYSQSHRFRHSRIEREDRIQHAVVGMLEALEKLDLDKDAKVSAAAFNGIRNELLRSEMRVGATVSIPHSKTSRRLRVAHARALREAADASPEEIVQIVAERTGSTPASVRAFIQARSASTVDHADTDIHDAGGAAEDTIQAQRARAMLDGFMAFLPARERQVVERCVMDGESLRSVGQDLDLSDARIAQIRRDGLEKLRRWMTKSGFRLEDLL